MDTLHFSSSGDSSIMSSHHGIPETNMAPEHQWLDIWNDEVLILFESKNYFFPGLWMAKLRRSFFWECNPPKRSFFSSGKNRAETSYGPK